MMKKILISIIIIFCLTGCFNYRELNDYSIISGISIDKEDDEYEVSILISNSTKNNSDKSSSESNVVVYSGKGDSIVSASKEIGLISPKELYFRAFSVVVLSEDVAKEGIKTALDFFLRYSSTGKNFYVVIAKDCKAKDTLKVKTPLANFPSQNISNNLTSTTKLQGIISKINFNDLLSILLRSGIDPTINTIKIVGKAQKGEENKNLETTEPNTYTKLDTLSIFKGDKLVAMTSHDESLGINIINDKINEMYLKIKTDGGYAIVDTTNFSSKRKVKLENNKPKVNLYFNTNARIIELTGKTNLEDPNVIKKLQKKACNKIKNFTNKALNVAFENEADIFGFGLEFYRNYPNYYSKVKKDWNKNLKKLDIDIKCNITFNNKMTANNSLEETYDKEKIN